MLCDDRSPTMAIQQRTTDSVYRCPSCGGSVRFDHQFWQCETCAYVPRHAAD